MTRFLVKKLPTLTVLRGHFDHFLGQKSHFLDFFKVVSELFRKCLGIVFDLKRPTFVCIFSSKGR